ncbi:hypothetical protein BO224_05675, partial [Erysipelotrichaceae bacterium NYU-BL-E8]
KRRIKGKVEIIIDKGTDSSEDRIHLNMREERMEQWQTALNRVIVCLVILFIDHEHILPKKAPHPLRIRCLFLFLDCQKFNSPLNLQNGEPLQTEAERYPHSKISRYFLHLTVLTKKIT